LELLQLKYFQTVAAFEHMTRAAEELHISQPSLSKTITHLETELGFKLFDRRGKYIRLNEYGKIFLKNVNDIFNKLEDTKKELKDLSGKESGNIKLLILSGSKFLPDYLHKFSQQYSHINFELIQHFSSLETVTDFDLCITSSAFKPDKTNCISLITEEIFLAVPSNHYLAGRTEISLKEAKDENFTSLQHGQILRKITDSYCRYAGFKPNIIFESDDPATLRGLIKIGQAVAFLPAITWGNSIGSSMTLMHIKEPVCKRTLYLFWPEDRYLSDSSKLFIKFLQRYFEKYKKNEFIE